MSVISDYGIDNDLLKNAEWFATFTFHFDGIRSIKSTRNSENANRFIRVLKMHSERKCLKLLL